MVLLYILSYILPVTCLVALVILLLFHIKALYEFRGFPGLGFPSYPLFGHSLLGLQNMDRQMDIILKMAEHVISKGNEIGLGWLGPKPILLIMGANAAEVLMRSSQHIEKAFLYFPIRSWLGDGLLTSSGDKWKSRRRLLTPTFHFSILKDFLEIMNEQAEVFVNSLSQYEGEYFDVCPRLTLCALDIICETAMGKKLNAQQNKDSEYVKAIYKATEMVQQRQKAPWLWPDFLYNISPAGRKYSRILETLHGFPRSVIKEKIREHGTSKQKKAKRLAFLDLLITASEDGKVLSSQDLQEEVDTFMFEGHDTTASAMTFALYLIGKYPEVQSRIVEELHQVVGKKLDQPLTFETLKKMEYMDAAIKESLRRYPSVPIIGRKTSADVVIDGHTVKKGTDCVMFLIFINNNPRYWPEYEDFNPDRFINEDSTKRHPYSFVPFSAGPRNCIGQKFAMMEIKVVLTHLLLKYAVKSLHEDSSNLKIRGNIVLKPESGVMVRITPR